MVQLVDITEKQRFNSPECKSHMLPVQDALDVLHGKWKLLILLALSGGPLRFKEIQREVGGITAKMLSKELKDLELNELVQRTVYDTIPVAVEYSRTAYGASLNKVLVELHNWGVQHRKRVMRKSRAAEA
jgi:DNA-binding HxlR family transcriptional regulator